MSLRSSIWPTATHASKESHRDGQVSTTALDFFLALASLDRKEILGYTLSLRGARTGGRGAFALAKICEMKSGELVVVKRSLKLHGPLWMFQDQEYAQYFKEFCLELRILIHDSLRSHENIINLKGIWDEDVAGVPSLSLVLEYGDHGTLDYFLQNAPRQKENQLSECISQLASGFKALHKLGICHGDVKTTNVLVVSNDSRWVCKICDFGHAVVSNTFKNESVQLPRGTAIYSAPEARDREISASFLPIITDAIFTDLYSFGLLIWEVLNKGEVYYNTIPTYDLPTPKSEFIHEFLRNLPQEKLFEYASVWIEAQDISKSPKDRLSYLVKGLLQHNPRDRLNMETVEELLSRNVSNSQTSSAVHNSNEYSTRPSSTQVSRSVQYENNSGSDSIISWSRELSLFQVNIPFSVMPKTIFTKSSLAPPFFCV
jgi:serine/threonine protein kinase